LIDLCFPALGPAATTKLAATPKEKENVQRRKSMRTPVPQPSEHREDLFEIEDLQLAIGGGGGGSVPAEVVAGEADQEGHGEGGLLQGDACQH
jgi:hypothetical protein